MIIAIIMTMIITVCTCTAFKGINVLDWIAWYVQFLDVDMVQNKNRHENKNKQ